MAVTTFPFLPTQTLAHRWQMKTTHLQLAKSLSRLHRISLQAQAAQVLAQAFLFHPLPRQVQNGPKIHANTKNCNLRVALLFSDLRTLSGGILGPGSTKTRLKTTSAAAIGSRMEAHVEVTTSYLRARFKWCGPGQKEELPKCQAVLWLQPTPTLLGQK